MPEKSLLEAGFDFTTTPSPPSLATTTTEMSPQGIHLDNTLLHRDFLIHRSQGCALEVPGCHR